jgi:hypothetical protein
VSASKAAVAAKVALESSGASAAVTIKTAESDVKITESASVAAAGAAESQASIPYIGPVLAVAAAAAMLALVLGFKGGGGGKSSPTVPSAAGGWWDIPRDTLAMVHEKEMVMPAHLSEGMRDAIEGGGFGGGPAVHIHATDAQSVANLFRNNKGALAAALKEQFKNLRGL